MDVVLLSRLQFGLTVMFHYIFPPLAGGMGIALVYLSAMYIQSGKPLCRIARKFWTKIFALNVPLMKRRPMKSRKPVEKVDLSLP